MAPSSYNFRYWASWSLAVSRSLAARFRIRLAMAMAIAPSNSAAVIFFVLVVTFVVGLISQAREGLLHPDDPTFSLHFFLGLISVIAALGVHCLIFIYFLGTGRWVKEVAIAYRIPDEPLPKLTRDLKRRAFPPALFAMLVPIAAAAAGTAVQRQEWHWTIHLGLAVATLAVN